MDKIKSVFTQYKGQSRSVYVLFIGRLVTSMGALIWPMLAMILSRKLGYSSSQVGIAVIIIGIIFLPATWIGGKLADKFNRKKLIVLLDTISVVFFIACAFTEPGTMMLVFFVIAGWFAYMEGPVFESLIIDVTRPEEREMAFSMVYLGKNLGMIIGTALGGLLFEHLLQLAFIIDGVTTMISTLLIVVFVVVVKVTDLEQVEQNSYEDDIDADEKTMRVLMDRKSILVQVGIYFLTGIVYDQIIFTLPLYMSDVYGANGAAYYGLVSSFNATIVILFTPIITKVSAKYSELPKIMVGIGLISLSYLMIVGNAVFMVFFAFMFVFTIGEIFNMLGTSPFFSRRVPATHRGRVSSYVYIAFFVGTMTGKGMAGFMIEYVSFAAVFMVVAIIGAITVLISYLNYGIDKERFPKLYQRSLELAEELEL